MDGAGQRPQRGDRTWPLSPTSPSASASPTTSATPTLLIGRLADADVHIDHPEVSRRHAVFARSGEGYLVRDVGSLNGTYVNRQRIDEAVLHPGDEVQIGKFRLVYYRGRP